METCGIQMPLFSVRGAVENSFLASDSPLLSEMPEYLRHGIVNVSVPCAALNAALEVLGPSLLSCT